MESMSGKHDKADAATIKIATGRRYEGTVSVKWSCCLEASVLALCMDDNQPAKIQHSLCLATTLSDS